MYRTIYALDANHIASACSPMTPLELQQLCMCHTCHIWLSRTVPCCIPHLFIISARSYTISRNFCFLLHSAPAINVIRFRHFRDRAIGCDARGSFSMGVLIHPPFALEVMLCRYVPTWYAAGAVQQRVLVSTMRTRDGSRRSKRQKD